MYMWYSLTDRWFLLALLIASCVTGCVGLTLRFVWRRLMRESEMQYRVKKLLEPIRIRCRGHVVDVERKRTFRHTGENVKDMKFKGEALNIYKYLFVVRIHGHRVFDEGTKQRDEILKDAGIPGPYHSYTMKGTVGEIARAEITKEEYEAYQYGEEIEVNVDVRPFKESDLNVVDYIFRLPPCEERIEQIIHREYSNHEE